MKISWYVPFPCSLMTSKILNMDRLATTALLECPTQYGLCYRKFFRSTYLVQAVMRRWGSVGKQVVPNPTRRLDFRALGSASNGWRSIVPFVTSRPILEFVVAGPGNTVDVL